MATVSYYFDGYDSGGEEWTETPEEMVDGSIETGARAITNREQDAGSGEIELCNSNTCNGSDIGTISKVEIRAYGSEQKATTNDKIILRPVFAGGDGDNHDFVVSATDAWSSWFDVTTDTNAPASWSWTNVDNLDCDVESYMDGEDSSNKLECFKVDIQVTYTPPPEYELPSGYIELAYSASQVTLHMPDTLIESATKSMQNLVFNDGTDKQLDRGKIGDSLTLGGMETSSATAYMDTLNTFMDNQRIITVTGLPDSNLNTDYRISSLDFNQEAGWMDRYSYSIVLERIYDKLG